MIPAEIKQLVKSSYGQFAASCLSQKSGKRIVSSGNRLGPGAYEQSELSAVPPTALNLSCGCGNPIGFAGVKPGRSVVDLGCGAGTDVIIAAHTAGEGGRVLGIDFTPEMVDAAKKGVDDADLQQKNIFFRVEDIEDIYSMPKSFADVVLSNCVLSLCPDVLTVYKNIFRILRPGGILIVSDIVWIEEIDPQLHERLRSTWIHCFGGALSEVDHERILTQMSFQDIQVVERVILTEEELETLAFYPDNNFVSPPEQEDLLCMKGKVASMTIMAMRPPLA